jgi:hypothetical protein
VISPSQIFLTEKNTAFKRDISMPPVGIEPAIPASEQPQIHTSDCAALESAKQHKSLKEPIMRYFYDGQK